MDKIAFKEKMRLVAIERWKNPKVREIISRKAKENWHSGKTKVSRQGAKLSDESKKKKSEAMKKYFQTMDMDIYRQYHVGKKQSEETKQKHSVFQKKLWQNKEWHEKRAKQIVEQNKSPEIRAKISLALKGKPKSAEHSQKVSATIKEWWQNPDNRKRMVGEKAFYWKGGVTPLRKLIRHCSKYKEWSLSVKKRDNYTCQKCQKRGGWLEADHYPDTFADIFYRNHIETANDAINCDEFWRVENGRTLCRKCHRGC